MLSQPNEPNRQYRNRAQAAIFGAAAAAQRCPSLLPLSLSLSLSLRI
jgi:hypothetical protein